MEPNDRSNITSTEEVVNKCLTCSCSGSEVIPDIDNPGDYYCVKCWDDYNADVAYKCGTQLVKDNRFLRKKNAALEIVINNILLDMDKMKKRDDRHWYEIWERDNKIRDLEAKFEREVESMAQDRFNTLQAEWEEDDTWYAKPRQNEGELHARIGELEAQIEELQATTSAGNRDNYLSDDNKSLFSSDDYSQYDNKSLCSMSDDDRRTKHVGNVSQDKCRN
jgi:hypothetical protein